MSELYCAVLSTTRERIVIYTRPIYIYLDRATWTVVQENTKRTYRQPDRKNKETTQTESNNINNIRSHNSVLLSHTDIAIFVTVTVPYRIKFLKLIRTIDKNVAHTARSSSNTVKHYRVAEKVRTPSVLFIHNHILL